MKNMVLSIFQADVLYSRASRAGFRIHYRSHNGMIGYITANDSYDISIDWSLKHSHNLEDPGRHGYVVTAKTPAAELWLAMNIQEMEFI